MNPGDDLTQMMDEYGGDTEAIRLRASEDGMFLMRLLGLEKNDRITV